MRTIKLGQSGLNVPELCLGTMTFGTQTSEADSHRQMDLALEAGVNFWDCAEMYPVNPVRRETAGNSEAIIGTWFETRGRRDEVVLATKVCGSDNQLRPEGYGPKVVRTALEASLKRMQTDYVDLYQLHWPNRGSYHFRKNWNYDPSHQNKAETLALMEDTLGALADLVQEGKIRAFGLSNETAWGLTRWVDVAERMGGPRPVTIQNEYSLLWRQFDTDLAETVVNEEIALMSWSPLAAGLLSGKYQNGAVPEGSRMSIIGNLGGRAIPPTFAAVDAYLEIAARHGLDPVQMALAWQRSRPFPVITILGATTEAQLQNILDGRDQILDPAVVKEIDATHRAHPMPF